MKKLNLSYIVIFTLIFTLFISCKNKNNEVFTSEIIYDAYILPVEYDMPFVNHLGYKDRQQVLDFIHKAMKLNKVTDSTGNIISLEQINNQLALVDSSFSYTQSNNLEKFILNFWDVIRFDESWDYNKKTGQIYKTVKKISFLKVIKDSFMMPINSKEIFSIELNAAPKKSKIDINKSMVIYDVCIIPLVENSSPYYHQISLSDKQKYFTDLFNIVKNNKITVLDYFYNLIPKKKTSELFYTRGIEDSTNKEINIPVSINEIGRIKFMEQWYWDTTNLSINKYVIGVNPGLKVMQEDDLIGYSPLFWAIFNKEFVDVLR